MADRVKGSMFGEYVRMLRRVKNLDRSLYFKQEDMIYLDEKILASNWYPMDSYERFGLAILREIAHGNMETVRAWGKTSMNELLKVYRQLLKPDNPSRSLNTFGILRSGFFDFEAFSVEALGDKRTHLTIQIGVAPKAQEAIAYQMSGMAEQLAELAGAKKLQAEFLQKAWEGKPSSLIEYTWQ